MNKDRIAPTALAVVCILTGWAGMATPSHNNLDALMIGGFSGLLVGGGLCVLSYLSLHND